MRHAAREHPFIFGLLFIAASPLILGAALLFVIAYVAGVGFDMIAGRP